MSNKILMSGNEACARGFYEAGGSVASSYPGSPTVDILVHAQSYNEITADWSVNEKVAIEVAMGASVSGARAMVSMKHVGVNIAMDPLMTFTQIKTNGGMLLVVGDDPGLTSSQNEQDTRIIGKFANMAILEPSTPQEVKDYVKIGLDISESYGMPVILKMTSRLCHARGVVEITDRQDLPIAGFEKDQARYCMLPPYANKAQYFMKNRLQELSNDPRLTNSMYCLIDKQSEDLIITAGTVFENLLELNLNVSILKLGICYPLNIDYIKSITSAYNRVIVIEELMPFIEDELKINGINCLGKDFFSFTGELTVDSLSNGLNRLGLYSHSVDEQNSSTLPRTPMLCAGCPHRPVFHILKKLKGIVVGDIGCYSLGILEPFALLNTNVSMGASLGMLKGMAITHQKINKETPLFATIGDGTFFHSGLTGFVELAKSDIDATVIVLDNRLTAMTGGQSTPTSNEYLGQDGYKANIKTILNSFGIHDVTEIDQFDYKASMTAIKEASQRKGLSVVISTRPCALNYKIKETNFYVDSNTCISCRSCIGVNCPPIHMKQYKNKDKLNSYIDPTMCVGCSVCSQVCPVGAIKRRGEY